jgi:putative membrane protein
MEPPARDRREPLVLWTLTCLVLAWSGYEPADRTVWLMEVAPVLVGGAVLALTYRRFPLTPLAYRLIFVFALILMVGGKYTYADVPVGNWARDVFLLRRNHFDRVGHFFQGVIPAILARELLLRKTPLRPGQAVFWIGVAAALAVSASYELLEWFSAVTTAPEQGTAFLGTQGDEWDAQKDMLMATLGAVLVQVLAARRHDREIEALGLRHQAEVGVPAGKD